MTKEQWDKVETTVRSNPSGVLLICDGYRLTLRIGRIKEMQLAIHIWVNGVLDFDWIKTDCEERRRFLRPHTSSVWSRKQLTQFKKFSKKMLKSYNIDAGKTFTNYYPWWNSFKSLKSHLIKNNTSIELAPEN